MWVEELGRELTGRMKSIWLGHNEDGTPIDMPEEKRQAYRRKWREDAAGGTFRHASGPREITVRKSCCGG